MLTVMNLFLFILTLVLKVSGFRMVVIPSLFDELNHNESRGHAAWIRDKLVHQKYNISVARYQRHFSDKSNYVKNQGSEAGVYLRYIVDHYNDFPDIAVFVHAVPHSTKWPSILACIRPNATFGFLNPKYYMTRDTHYGAWWEIESWVEQCYRYVLRIVWNLTEPSQLHTFNRLVPIDRPIVVNFTCCQNFHLSRAMVQRRPLHVWQKLYTIITQQDVCREGEIDYKNMFSNMTKLGPERPFKHGRDTQGNAMEHLAHVVFGHLPLQMSRPTMDSVCQQFYPNCDGSPCDAAGLKTLPFVSF